MVRQKYLILQTQFCQQGMKYVIVYTVQAYTQSHIVVTSYIWYTEVVRIKVVATCYDMVRSSSNK